jgi:hypothetical protein
VHSSRSGPLVSRAGNIPRRHECGHSFPWVRIRRLLFERMSANIGVGPGRETRGRRLDMHNRMQYAQGLCGPAEGPPAMICCETPLPGTERAARAGRTSRTGRFGTVLG